MRLDNLVCCSAKLTPLTMDRRGRRDRCGRIRSGSCYEAECLKQKTSRGVDRGFVRVCGEGLAVGMALSAKTTMRQGQTMVLTPQLLQAIKLLQMPNLELTQFIENELASNPLLERAEEREEVSLQQADPEAYVGEAVSLRDHLERQAAILLPDPAERMIGAALIDALDEAGYVVGSIEEIAERLRADGHPVERVLLRLQTLEPTGVFARSLAECLALQLKERDRFDPAMQAFIENLPALA